MQSPLLSVLRGVARCGTGAGIWRDLRFLSSKRPANRPPAPSSPPPPPPSSAALKAASRLFQRVTTPEPERKPLQDLSVDPAGERLGGYLYGQIKGRTYIRARNYILTRIATGFGIALPGVGLVFGAKSAWDEGKRTASARRERGRVGADSLALAAATAADVTNVLVTGTSLGRALREHAPLHWPTARENFVTQYTDYAAAIGLDPSLGPSLALASTLFAAYGEVRRRYDSVPDFLRDKAPTATAKAGAAARAAAEGDLETAAREAASAADRAVDEALTDALARPGVADKVGDSIAEVLPARTGKAAKEAAQKVSRSLEDAAAQAASASAGTSARGGEGGSRKESGAGRKAGRRGGA
jgi:hypothetical protein